MVGTEIADDRFALMKQKNWPLLWKTMEVYMLYRLLPDLGAPWWQGDIKAAILGMTLGTGKPHVLRGGA